MQRFFPRSTLFWLLQLSCCFIILAFFIAGLETNSPLNPMLYTGNFIWQLSFIFAGLGFRAAFSRYQLTRRAIVFLIVVAIIYSGVMGLLQALLVVSVAVPLFWHNFMPIDATHGPLLVAADYVPNMILGVWKQSQLFICIWCFVYISFQLNRNAKAAEIDNLRLQNSLKEAQLNSLANQLNPHFLFNALNNIRFTIHENAQRADDMITALSEILRYSLEAARQQKVPLRQEMAIIERYIAIMTLQLEQRLQFISNFPEATLDYLVPPMVLQLLIENAIKHGLENIRRGGELILDISEQDDAILVIITNDLPEHAASPPLGMGLGLQNIQQRLQLLYGNRATLQIRHEHPVFSVTMGLPKELSL